MIEREVKVVSAVGLKFEKLHIFAPMKRLVVIGLLLLAVAACTSKVPKAAEQSRSTEEPSPELAAIDCLMWRRPDSALMCLLPWFDTCRDAMLASPPNETDTALETHPMETHTMRLYNRHYAHLLLAELLYKNYQPQTNRAELQKVVAYFDSLLVVMDERGADTRGVSLRRRDNRRDASHASAQNVSIAFLDARAHYINGVGYYENDSLVPACQEYIRALEMMDEHFEEKDLVGKKAYLTALIYTRLTVLFSNLYLNKQAICFGKKSLSYYEKSGTSSWQLSWMLSKIGTHYNMMEQLDSADYYYQRAMSCLPDTNNNIYRDLVAQRALLSYQTGCQYKNSIKSLLHMVNFATSDKERLARYLSIADVYYNEQQLDSAKVYFERVYCDARNPDHRMLAADRLREISIADGDSLKANEYALARSQFTTEKDKEGNLNSDLTTLCQQYELSRQEIQHRLKTQRTAKRWSFVIGLAILVVAVAFIMLMILKRRMRSEQYLHKLEQAALSGKLKKSNEALREMKSQIKRLGNAPKPDEAATFVEEPICRLIMERVNEGQFLSQMDCRIYKDYALCKEHVVALREAADRHFDQFTIRLAKAYPELTRSDLDYCCLYLLGLNDADIAALMQRAYNTVNERNSKLKTIFESENALSSTLLNFANKNTFS